MPKRKAEEHIIPLIKRLKISDQRAVDVSTATYICKAHGNDYSICMIYGCNGTSTTSTISTNHPSEIELDYIS